MLWMKHYTIMCPQIKKQPNLFVILHFYYERIYFQTNYGYIHAFNYFMWVLLCYAVLKKNCMRLEIGLHLMAFLHQKIVIEHVSNHFYVLSSINTKSIFHWCGLKLFVAHFKLTFSADCFPKGIARSFFSTVIVKCISKLKKYWLAE